MRFLAVAVGFIIGILVDEVLSGVLHSLYSILVDVINAVSQNPNITDFPGLSGEIFTLKLLIWVIIYFPAPMAGALGGLKLIQQI
jgi:hypothetical protein